MYSKQEDFDRVKSELDGRASIWQFDRQTTLDERKEWLKERMNQVVDELTPNQFISLEVVESEGGVRRLSRRIDSHTHSPHEPHVYSSMDSRFPEKTMLGLYRQFAETLAHHNEPTAKQIVYDVCRVRARGFAESLEDARAQLNLDEGE